MACHNKRAIPMTVEIFFSDDSSAWEEEEKRHQLPFFPQSIKEGLPICNVCVLVGSMSVIYLLCAHRLDKNNTNSHMGFIFSIT